MIIRKLLLAMAGCTLLAACQSESDTTQTQLPAAAAETQEVTMQNDPAALPEPRAEKRPHEMTIHGDTRIDEYYWLRDDDRSDPEVLAYLEAENAYFEHKMAHTESLQEALYQEMTGRLDPDESSVPFERDGYWYYYRFEKGNEYAIYARRKGSMDAPEEILIDGNLRAKDHEFYRLSNVEVSDDHRYVAISEDTVGRRINEIRILDTQSGEFLNEVIANAEGSLAWSADGEYLFYMDKHPQTLLGYRLMRHKRGTEPTEDVLVYEETDNTFYNGVGRSRSGDYIILGHGNTDTTEMKYLRADEPLGEFTTFLPRQAGHEYSVDHAGDMFYIRSNLDAVNFKVMSATLETAADPSQWKEIIPHREDAMIRNVVAFDNWLMISERKDGLRQVRVMSHDGKVDRYLEANSAAYTMYPAENPTTNTNTVRYGYTSMIEPSQTWELNLSTGEKKLLKETHVPGGFDSANYLTIRTTITARDGAQVPVSMAMHKDTPQDGTAPALIYAYGSYGSSQDPTFNNSSISLMDRGFVYVIAHIRGGQELGRRWYEDGKMMNKKNTFTDFIDVTRGLQEQNKIDPRRTFAYGGSAGGLLMGAVINMAPELYRGVVAAVPFVDVVTTMLDESIPLTTGEFKEWGNPKDKEAYDYMLSYAPYDQVKAQDYPNLMITTGLHDSQVQYFEPAKWVARLRDRRTDSNVLIMDTNMDAGHGGASGRYRAYEEAAQRLAFMVDLAGVE